MNVFCIPRSYFGQKEVRDEVSTVKVEVSYLMTASIFCQYSKWDLSLISMSEIEFLWCVCVCVCVCVNIFELFENDIGGRNESKLLALVNFLVPKTEFKIYSK